jgi:AmiR/NasT family two-component response regulator
MRVVMITAHGTREVMSKASESGVQTIVLKPFTPGELADGVAKAVGQLGAEPPPPA